MAACTHDGLTMFSYPLFHRFARSTPTWKRALPFTLLATSILVGFNALAESDGPAQCTLDRSTKVAVMKELRAFMKTHAAKTTQSAFTFSIRSDGAATVASLERLIAREAACCSQLTIKTAEQGRQILITVSGPHDEVDRARAAIGL